MSSLWSDTAPAAPARPALRGRHEVDVAVVGAGYTGLWTAYYLLERDPDLRVVVVERESVGFGASGRNGGWCSALYPVSAPALARRVGPDGARAQYAAMRDSVAEVVRVVGAEGIQADLAVGGTVVAARSAAQLERAREEVAESDQFGLGLDLLDESATRARLDATGVLGGTYTPHCAVVHPLKLVRGLAEVVERRGVTIAEHTPAETVSPGRVAIPGGSIRAGTVVRATEGYTPALPGQRRAVAPVYSLIVATEPLPDSTWDRIGLGERETFSDFRHLIVYGQRSADGRLVFGGRGAPYHFGSRIRAGYDTNEKVFAALRATAIELFPVLAGHRFTHGWGGPLGIARDWQPSVGITGDDGARLAWAGGYVGDGVSTTNLAGRTVAALITGTGSPSDRTAVGRAPLAALGAGAAALAGCECRTAGHDVGRSRRTAVRPSVADGRAGEPGDGPLGPVFSPGRHTQRSPRRAQRMTLRLTRGSAGRPAPRPAAGVPARAGRS